MRFENTTFENQVVRLDSNQFVNCTFRKCTLSYGGAGEVILDSNSFFDVKWEFVEAAARTMQFLSALYKGAGVGGKRLVETTFQNIKSGSV